jgi:beta propeller repeat protein
MTAQRKSADPGRDRPSQRRRLRRILTLLLVGVAFAALAGTAQARRDAGRGAPAVFPVCIAMGGQAGPDIAGRMVVWTDNRNGQLDVYGRDLAKATDFAVCKADGSQDNPSVAAVTTGSRTEYEAVWVDKRNHDGGDIYGRNITTRKDFVVARTPTLKWFPEICDQWVAWVEAKDPAGPYTIKARDLVAAKTYKVATSTVLSSLGLSRRTVDGAVAYTAVYASSGGDISGRDLPAGTPFSVSQASAFEWSPDISGDRVVWWQDGERVLLRNLKTGVRTLVGTGSRPRVDGQLVVWDGGGHGGEFVLDYKAGAAVYVRNVARSKNVVKITQNDLTCLFPAVSGTTVVWEAGPARRVLGHIHIYGARLR